MTSTSLISTLHLTNTLNTFGLLELANSEAEKASSSPYKTLVQCAAEIEALEKLADCIQDLLENLAEYPTALSKVPIWKNLTQSTAQMVESAKNKTICAIAKTCLQGSENTYTDSSYQRNDLEKRLRNFAKQHFEKSVYLTSKERHLWNRAITHLQDFPRQDSIEWELIDRLIHVFFTIHMAQTQYFDPAETKKKR